MRIANTFSINSHLPKLFKNEEHREWVVCNFLVPHNISRGYFIHWVIGLEVGSGAASKEGEKHESGDPAWSELASSFLEFLPHIFLLEVNSFSLRFYTSLSCQQNDLSQGQCLQAIYFLSSITHTALLSLLYFLQNVLVPPPLTQFT